MADTTGTEVLTDTACWERLRRTSVGRLATESDGQPDIFPINFVLDGESIVFRTKPGTKLAASAGLQRIAFEIDGYEPQRGTAWSVVVKGRARTVDGMHEQFEVDRLPLFPWVTFDKPVFVRIIPIEVTGRRFTISDDVIADGGFGWDRIRTFYDGDDSISR
jgi:hypothetical protein